jgi:DNA-binding NarL/FixJ family response regulator
MQQQTRLFHVEYLGIVRDLVKYLFKDDNTEIILARQETDAVNLIKILGEEEIDVLLLGNNDTRGNPTNYTDLCGNIRRQFPNLKILVHSFFSNSSNIIQAMNTGIQGFISGDMGADDLLIAINTVKNGQVYLSKKICDSCKNSFEFLAGFADRLLPKTQIFTDREFQVLDLIAKGYKNKQIADELFISFKTVETHRKNLVTKARVRNSVELIAYSITYGFL